MTGRSLKSRICRCAERLSWVAPSPAVTIEAAGDPWSDVPYATDGTEPDAAPARNAPSRRSPRVSPWTRFTWTRSLTEPAASRRRGEPAQRAGAGDPLDLHPERLHVLPVDRCGHAGNGLARAARSRC